MSKKQAKQVTLSGLSGPTRLDKALREAFPQWGRKAVQQTISSRQVSVNGRVVWIGSWQVENGDRVEVLNPPVAKPTPPSGWDESWLIEESGDLIVVNKPEGLLSESPPHRDAVNLLDLAQSRFGPLVLFHRLDRDTSGVILLSRPGAVNRYLDWAFQERLVKKEYVAVVAAPNQLARVGTIDAYIGLHPQRREMVAVVERGGKHAVTDYEIISAPGPGRPDAQAVRLWPRTGRTHQLRVHLAHMNAPILGDRLYGNPESSPRLLLHAFRLVLPAGQDDYPERTFTAPVPEGFWPSTVDFLVKSYLPTPS